MSLRIKLILIFANEAIAISLGRRLSKIDSPTTISTWAILYALSQRSVRLSWQHPLPSLVGSAVSTVFEYVALLHSPVA